ncbi:MAG: exodeoxyribonuclease VII large subunit [Planctomycetota bacterium]|nr:exodeoxyribonuclease VII large subunit [Planctomycetota bacterium]
MARRGFRDPARGAPRPEPDPESGRPRARTVSELTLQIKLALESGFPPAWVEGEISNFRRYGSGHSYFTLKDEAAQLSCVLWRGHASSLRFEPRDGMQVLAFGRVSVYEARGQYQLVVERMEPSGVGALSAAFEALKARLEAEGLFDPGRKKPLPAYPRRIALVTSPSGAAVRDMLKVLGRRWPKLEIVLVPVAVQGEGAARQIAAGIRAVNALPGVDAMIVGRGGGSLEDLWAFNEEPVARAIAASRVPVVSAVGHEIDFTIADFVADVRAATPSQAGELVVPEYAAVAEHLERLAGELPAALLGRVERARERLAALAGSWAFRNPGERVQLHRQRLDDLHARLGALRGRLVREPGERLAASAARLDSLSPLRVLERGYAVALRARDGRVVREPGDVRAGDELITRLRRGRIVSKVERAEKEES